MKNETNPYEARSLEEAKARLNKNREKSKRKAKILAQKMTLKSK